LDKFVSYFNGPARDQPAFDIWHHDMCELFLDYFENDFVDLQYGKAQKIVNMTFKNIYCLQGADQNEKFFTHCHMPLDSFTLEWFYRVGQASKAKINGSKVARKYPSWSKLKYSGGYNNNNRTYLYMDIQEFIRGHVAQKHSNNCTPLQAEFLIWPQIQFELAAEGFYSQLVKIDEKLLQSNLKAWDFKKLNIKDKIDWFNQNYNGIDFKFIQSDLSSL
jgi:hypothetical protein